MKNVSIYTTNTCHFCHMAKDFFQEKGIEFKEFNVSNDMTKRKEMIDMTGQMGVPVIKIDDEVIIGFNKPRVAELLGVEM